MALGHSLDITGSNKAYEFIHSTRKGYPKFNLFEENKKAVNQYRQVLKNLAGTQIEIQSSEEKIIPG